MVPAGEATAKAVDELGRLMAEGDTIIDGGNSFWKDDIARAKRAARERASTISMSAPAAACGGWSAAIA